MLIPLRLASVDAIPTMSDMGLGMNGLFEEEEEEEEDKIKERKESEAERKKRGIYTNSVSLRHRKTRRPDKVH